jgi:hypothetical protein
MNTVYKVPCGGKIPCKRPSHTAPADPIGVNTKVGVKTQKGAHRAGDLLCLRVAFKDAKVFGQPADTKASHSHSTCVYACVRMLVCVRACVCFCICVHACV